VNASPLKSVLVIEIADGKTTRISEGYSNCVIEIEGHTFPVQLLPITLGGFHVVIGMDWMSIHDAAILCSKKIVRILTPKGEVVSVYGNRRKRSLKVINVMKALKCIHQTKEHFLAYVINARKEKATILIVDVARDFPDVFTDDLPGIPPDREVTFHINLVPGATPVAKAPYRLANCEIKELMSQLQELLDKGFICPSSSPWGAPILFVKKKDGSMRMCIDYR